MRDRFFFAPLNGLRLRVRSSTNRLDFGVRNSSVLVPNLAPGAYPVIVTTHGQSSQDRVVVPVQ